MKVIKEYEEKVYKIEIEEEFVVEICEKEGCIEYWIYNKEYGIKYLMFILPMKYDKKQVKDIIESNIEDEIIFYKERYM